MHWNIPMRSGLCLIPTDTKKQSISTWRMQDWRTWGAAIKEPVAKRTNFFLFWVGGGGGCCITKTHASQQHKEIHKHKTQREYTWIAISFELLQFLFSRENSSSCSSHPALKGIDILWELIPPRRNMMQPWVRKELRYDFSFCSLARPSWLITRVCKIGGVRGHVIAPI